VIRPLAFLAALLCASVAQASSWTLDELVKKVERDAPNVLAAQHALEAAQDNLRAAQFGWLPTGDATLGLSGSPNVKCLGPHSDLNPQTDVPLPDSEQAIREQNCLRTNVVSLNGANTNYFDIAPIHGVVLQLNINLNQQLYSFGRLEAAIDAAKAQLETAKGNLEAAQAEAVWYANRAYWGLKASRAAVDALGEAVDKLKEWVQTIDDELNGKNKAKYSESDLKRMQIALAYANTQLYDQQRNLSYAKEALQFLAGEPDADIDDSDLELIDDPAPLPTWQSRALSLRPEYHLLRANDAFARSQRKARMADLMPNLTFTSQLAYGFASSMDTPQNYYFNRPNYLNVTLGLSLTIGLDFGPKAMRFIQAKRDEEASVLRSKGSMLQYQTDIAKAWEDYNEARLRAKEAARGEKISRGWYFAVNSNVQSGLAEAREMVEALQNYFTFRLRSFQSMYDANIALAALRRATVGASK
jgi:outer membrane protein TolC